MLYIQRSMVNQYYHIDKNQMLLKRKYERIETNHRNKQNTNKKDKKHIYNNKQKKEKV